MKGAAHVVNEHMLLPEPLVQIVEGFVALPGLLHRLLPDETEVCLEACGTQTLVALLCLLDLAGHILRIGEKPVFLLDLLGLNDFLAGQQQRSSTAIPRISRYYSGAPRPNINGRRMETSEEVKR